MFDALDLVLPLACGGCGAPATRWCDVCAATLRVGPDQPHLITPRHDPGVPVFALGRYAGARRQAIVAAKERGRADLVPPLAAALAGGIHQLTTWGLVDTPLVVIPAPTRRSAARRRGGDPVYRIATAATRRHPAIVVQQALRMTALARDSVGLSSGGRERNIAGRVVLTASPCRDGDILLVDDIITTGATASESVRVLVSAGARVTAVLTLAHA